MSDIHKKINHGPSLLLNFYFVIKSLNNNVLIDIVRNFIIEYWYYLNVIKTFKNQFCAEAWKMSIITIVNEFRKNIPKFKLFRSSKNLSFLFYGMSQTGKTSMVYTIAQIYDMMIYSINVKFPIMSQIGNIPDNSIILFEDIDKICDMIENLVAMHSILDNKTHLKKNIVIMTTNHYNKLNLHLYLKYGDRDQFNYEFGPRFDRPASSGFATLSAYTCTFYGTI